MDPTQQNNDNTLNQEKPEEKQQPEEASMSLQEEQVENTIKTQSKAIRKKSHDKSNSPSGIRRKQKSQDKHTPKEDKQDNVVQNEQKQEQHEEEEEEEDEEEEYEEDDDALDDEDDEEEEGDDEDEEVESVEEDEKSNKQEEMIQHQAVDTVIEQNGVKTQQNGVINVSNREEIKRDKSEENKSINILQTEQYFEDMYKNGFQVQKDKEESPYQQQEIRVMQHDKQVYLRVSNISDGIVTLISEDYSTVEMPIIFLPNDISCGSVIKLSIDREYDPEEELKQSVLDVQQQILSDPNYFS